MAPTTSTHRIRVTLSVAAFMLLVGQFTHVTDVAFASGTTLRTRPWVV